MFGGSEDKEYPCFESNASKMLDKLLKKGLMKLPKSKRPKEIRKKVMFSNVASIIGSSAILWRSARHSMSKSYNLQRKERMH